MRRLTVLAALIGVLLVGVGASSARPTKAAEATQGRWVMRDLGTFGKWFSEAVAINDRGQIIGEADPISGAAHAFLWQNGKMTDLGSLGGGEVIAINSRGQVLMWAYTNRTSADGAGIYRTFLWQNGRTTTIGTPKDRITPVAINDRGQVVGTMSKKV